MTLSSEEKDLISKKIENLEKSSSAELVAVITKKSSNYKFVRVMISIFLVFLISFSLIFTIELSTLQLIEIQLLSFIGINLFFEHFHGFLLSILPKSYKQYKASQNAQEQFYNLGLNRTKTKQGVMFFVSFDEKYVEIISDTTISSKIENTYWQKVVDEFIKDVKKKELSNGYLKAIDSCSGILIKEFPIQKNDKNELPNDVIELR